MKQIICKLQNTKTRIDKGMDKINIKTLFIVILLILCVMLFLNIYNKKNNVVYIINNKEIIKPYIVKDTIYKEKIIKKNIVKKEKKINFTIDELKEKGVKTYTEQNGIYKQCKIIKK